MVGHEWIQMALSVNAKELTAGVNKVAPLFGDCQTATTTVVDSLGGMISAVGHPELSSALESFTESSANALLNTAHALTFIAVGLKSNAAEYDKTETNNANNINKAGQGTK
jgi:hypothetical protein